MATLGVPPPSSRLVLDTPRSLERGDGFTPAVGALHQITLELFNGRDAGAIAGKVLSSVSRVLVVSTSSIWVPVGDSYECRGAIGERADALTRARMPADAAGS